MLDISETGSSKVGCGYFRDLKKTAIAVAPAKRAAQAKGEF